MNVGTSRTYDRYARVGVVVGLGLLFVGKLGSVVGPAVLGSLPGWERTALVDAMWAGVAIAVLSVVVFAIALPRLT